MLPYIALTAVNVHLSGRHILKDVWWSLEPGRHWGFEGPNGSGKSTLLRVIAGTQWIDHDGGARTYSPDGARLDAVARAGTWIRHVSAEQHERYARLDLPLSGRELVASGLDDSVYLHRPPAAAEAARVDDLIERFDLGGFAPRAIRALSSGQLRRLLVARALVARPRVLVLDEFGNGVDSRARHEILDVLNRSADSVALIVASHRRDDFPAAITDTAIVRDGRIRAAGRAAPPLRRAATSPARPRPATESARSRAAANRVALATAADAPVLIDIRGADVYRGSTLVLRGVDWRLRAGEHTAISGANGSGKTTFAGLIAGTIPAATGAEIVRFGEREPFDVWKLKERIAHVSDDLQIAYNERETVEAVIASGFVSSIGLFAQPTRAQSATVDDVIRRVGLDALRGRTFTQLSFGERRKVLIARSLIRRPAIFILDEVWNGLDAAFRAALRGMLAEMAAAGTTLVAIAHDDDEELAALTPRVCSIADGRVHEPRPPRRR